MIIAPQRAFLVDYRINNPSDTATHYVRAVIKNSITGVILATLNLTDGGSGYFSKEWVTPADTTGTGTQISILTTVYDDAGYTSESLVYGTTLDTRMVRDLASSRNSYGMGGMLGGVNQQAREIDYKLIKEMIEKAIKSIVFPAQQAFPEIPEQKEVDLSSIENLKNSTEEKFALLDNKIDSLSNDLKSEYAKQIRGLAEDIKLIRELPNKFELAEVSDDNLHSFIEEKMGIIEKQTSEMKSILENHTLDLMDKIENKLSEPVQIELAPGANAERFKRERAEKEEVPQENPRMAIFNKLLGNY